MSKSFFTRINTPKFCRADQRMNPFKDLRRIKITSAVYLGFGLVVGLLLIISTVAIIGLISAQSTFNTYRTLARQTNAEGRVQANMLMTRLFAKNFVIDASPENIAGVNKRARQTIKLIKQARNLSSDPGFVIVIDEIESELKEYITHFQQVTKKQESRNRIVLKTLNVVGPNLEKKLTTVMETAFKKGHVKAAYRAGLTLRSLMLARLYASRFLIQNDDASYQRVRKEFVEMETNEDQLMSVLDDPIQKKRVEKIKSDHRFYEAAFTDVHNVITARNNIIKNQLDRIGPKVAAKIEKLKLAIKARQDELGPKAKATIDQGLWITSLIAIGATIIGLFAAWLVSTPVKSIAYTMRELAAGNMDIEVPSGVQSREITQMIAAVHVFRDNVAERQKLLEEREESVKEIGEARDLAEAATAAKATFLASMSHEIRTPMNGVVGMVQLLTQSELDDDQRDMVRTIKESADSLLAIIDDILDFSKIEAGKLTLENIPVLIRDVVEGTADTLSTASRKKRIRLLTYVDPRIPTTVFGDKVRLRQVLLNLAGNAVKFTSEGKVVISAELVEPNQDGKCCVRFKVEDTGVGISDEAKSRLFEAFSQAEDSTTRRFGGTGLGLSICSRLIDMMGGTIELQSMLGVGSIFTVTVQFETSEEIAADEKIADLSDLRVLAAVEDNKIRTFIDQYLRYWNAQALSVTHTDMAFPCARKALAGGEPYHIVILEAQGRIDAPLKARGLFSEDPKLGDTCFVIIEAESEDSPPSFANTVIVNSNPFTRTRFMKSVAHAAGRVSPDTVADLEVEEFDRVEVPTVEEAAARGELILIAEDNVTNQDVIRRQLKLLGYAAAIFDDGRQAFNAWRANPYAILLTDCHMPEMDGYQLAAAIREDEKGGKSRFPIIAITANAMLGETGRCFEAGMDDYLSKPLDMGKLKNILRKWMPGPTGDAPQDKTAPALPAGDSSCNPDVGTNGPIDPNALNSIFGHDPEAIRDILADFIAPAWATIAEIETAFKNRNAEDVGALGHKLKSSSRSIGAGALSDTCEALETAAKAENWEVIEDAAPKLRGFMQEVEEYIAAQSRTA